MSRCIWRRVVDFVIGDLPKESRPQLSASASAICSERRLRERVDLLQRENRQLEDRLFKLEAEARIGRAVKELWNAVASDQSVEIEVRSFTAPAPTAPLPVAE